MRRLPVAVLALAVAGCESSTPTAPSTVPPLPAGSYVLLLSGSDRTCPGLAVLPRGLFSTHVPVVITHEAGAAVARPAPVSDGSFEMRFDAWSAPGSIGETSVSGTFSGQVRSMAFADPAAPALSLRLEGTSRIAGTVRLPLAFGRFDAVLALTLSQQPIVCPASTLNWNILAAGASAQPF